MSFVITTAGGIPIVVHDAYTGYRANLLQWWLACALLWVGNPWRFDEALCRYTMYPHRVLLARYVP